MISAKPEVLTLAPGSASERGANTEEREPPPSLPRGGLRQGLPAAGARASACFQRQLSHGTAARPKPAHASAPT